jgi:hypothetical protein
LKAGSQHTDAHENDETGLEDKKEALMANEEDVEVSLNQPAPWSSLFSGWSNPLAPDPTIVVSHNSREATTAVV